MFLLKWLLSIIILALLRFSTAQRVFNHAGDRYLTGPIIDLPLERISDRSVPTGDSVVTVLSIEIDDPRLLHPTGFLTSGHHDFYDGGALINTRDIVAFRKRHPDLEKDIGQRFEWYAFIGAADLASGPYFMSAKRLSHAYRLFDDDQKAFMTPVKPWSQKQSSFEPLGIAATYPDALSVAVPSRLVEDVDGDRHLRGLRFAVKDIFTIAGIRMSLTNKAFYELAKPADKTAQAIQQLIDAGATMVGTVKCTSMISREEPAESVDFQVPWNPRGDGYQSPAGSSSGSAVAIASYDWLDFTIGSDTTGSSRRPAFVNGCFQLRPSQSLVSLEGAYPSFMRFDAPAIFTRDLSSLEKVLSVWSVREESNKFTVIYYPNDFWQGIPKDQEKLVEKFVQEVQSALNIKLIPVEIESTWNIEEGYRPVDDATGQEVPRLRDYLKDVGLNTFIYWFYHSTDEFRDTYRRQKEREPYVNPVTRWRWEKGAKITKAQHNEAMHRMDIYKEWFLKKILKEDSENALFLLPVAQAEPNFRDQIPGEPFIQDVWDPLWVAPVLGAPEITVPIGYVERHSRISGKNMQLPVAISILSLPGTDTALVDAVTQIFETARRRKSVPTGPNLWHSPYLQD